MRTWKIKFLTEKHGEETVTAEYTVTVHQYIKILEQVKKFKGIR